MKTLRLVISDGKAWPAQDSDIQVLRGLRASVTYVDCQFLPLLKALARRKCEIQTRPLAELEESFRLRLATSWSHGPVTFTKSTIKVTSTRSHRDRLEKVEYLIRKFYSRFLIDLDVSYKRTSKNVTLTVRKNV